VARNVSKRVPYIGTIKVPGSTRMTGIPPGARYRMRLSMNYDEVEILKIKFEHLYFRLF